MSYALAFKPSAEKELRNLPREMIARIVPAIRELADDPRPHGCVKLSGSQSWRIRVGTYRVIYDIADDARRIDVLHIGHRRDAYR